MDGSGGGASDRDRNDHLYPVYIYCQTLWIRRFQGGNSRFAYLKDLPRHAEFNLGDTVVTSGYSTVFPEGVMVGTVDDMSDSHDGLSYLLKIKLATDFGKVSNVRVISRNGQDEQKALESRADEK